MSVCTGAPATQIPQATQPSQPSWQHHAHQLHGSDQRCDPFERSRALDELVWKQHGHADEPLDPKRRKLDLATSSGSESEATSSFAAFVCESAPVRSKGHALREEFALSLVLVVLP